MKVLYVYSGTRKDRFKGVAGHDYPDTQFYGLNHLNEYGVDAEYKEFESYPFGKSLARIIGFRLKHFLMYFVARRYDVVFGISVIYMVLWKKILKTKTKFVVFNSVFNRMFIVHKEGSWKRKIFLWVLREVDGVVFLGREHMRRVVAAAPFLKDRSYFVPMGVDATYYEPQYEGRKSFFLSVGRDNARDYGMVVDVARRLPQEEFHIVCLPRNIAHISDIPVNVKVHINIPSAKLKTLYREAKALLLIMHDDSYLEGSDSSGPTVLLEAMAIGLPIIASKKSYMTDYLVDIEDALLVDFYDVDGIVKAIQAIADREAALRLAKNARHKVDTTFNTNAMARGLAQVFEEIYARK